MSTQPDYDAQGMWRIWNYNDVYFGPTGSGQYVPKVHDEVHQIVGASISRFICIAVDQTSLIPTLSPVTEQVYGQDVLPTDMLLGKTPDTYRLLINTNVSPYRMNVDARLQVSAKSAQYCKIFKGTNISSTGTVISQWYDNTGNFVSENLPMDLVSGTNLIGNVGIKSVTPGWTAAILNDGDLVTAVIFAADGTPLSIRTLFVQNTGFVRGTDAYSKAVFSIALESPFLSATNSTTINYPVNVPLNALNLVGVVNYSDGSQSRFAVDGTKFSVSGLEAYAPTIVGQTVPIVLKYRLQAGETAYGSQNGASNHFSEEYTLVTTAVDGSYQVQLYCYPVWVSAQSGYRLSWFMYDLDRSVNYNVTGLVQIDPAVGAFSPTNYGAKQTIRAFLNLKNVSAIYQNFVHIQNVDIVLNSPATTRTPRGGLANWLVTQQGGSVPLLGAGVYATYSQLSQNNYQLSLAGDFTTYADWLNAYYTLSRPLYNPNVETTPPAPTHFNVVAGGVTTTYPITSWNSTLVLTQPLTNNDTVYLEFFQRTAASDLQLSKVGLLLKAVDSQGAYL